MLGISTLAMIAIREKGYDVRSDDRSSQGNGLSCEACENMKFPQANLKQISEICGLRKRQFDLLQEG